MRKACQTGRCLEIQSASVIYITQTLDKALPVGAEFSAPIVFLSIRTLVQVGFSVIIVDMKDSQFMTESVYLLTNVLSRDISVANVKAIAENIFASLGIEGIYLPTGLLCVGAGAVNNVIVFDGKQIFKTDLDSVLLCRRYQLTVHIEIYLGNTSLRHTVFKIGVDHDSRAADIFADRKKLVCDLNEKFRELGISLNVHREGRVSLFESYPVS